MRALSFDVKCFHKIDKVYLKLGDKSLSAVQRNPLNLHYSFKNKNFAIYYPPYTTCMTVNNNVRRRAF